MRMYSTLLGVRYSVHCRTQPPLLSQTALYRTLHVVQCSAIWLPTQTGPMSHWMTRGLQCMHSCVVHSGSHASHTHGITSIPSTHGDVKPHHEQYTRGSCTSQVHNLPSHTSCCTVGNASEQALFMVFMTSASALGQTAVGEHWHQVVVITGCYYLSRIPQTGQSVQSHLLPATMGRPY